MYGTNHRIRESPFLGANSRDGIVQARWESPEPHHFLQHDKSILPSGIEQGHQGP